MSYIIHSIVSKPKWMDKINNMNIVNKWIRELQNEGIDNNKINIIMKLLKQMKDNNYTIEQYSWFNKLEFNVSDIFYDICNCKCEICKGNENDMTESIAYCKNICKCIISNRNCRSDFLTKFINNEFTEFNQSNLIQLTEKYKLLNNSSFHSGSNILYDVIHPSLTCYIDGVTEIKDNEYNLTIDENMLFQWLPLNVNNNNNEYEIKIESLMSEDQENNQIIIDMYKEINQIFNKMVPMFNKVLLSLTTNKIIDDTISLMESCQVIVKIQEIQLTPDKPNYDSSSWHLEGTKYEKIIATGIYYYDMENIEENYLSFRTNLNDEADYQINYPQNCPIYVNHHYGLESSFDHGHNKFSYVKLGNVKTEKNMLLTFPNFMQHKVSNIKLKDKMKIGFRKILVFFLVDPRQKILSLDDVIQPTLLNEDKLDYESILMYQRTFETKNQNEIYCREISLCEH